MTAINPLSTITNADIINVKIKAFEKGIFKPLKLHDRQLAAMSLLTDSQTDEILFGGAAGGGKAQPLDAMVLTPFGFRPMGSINVGSIIMHPSGANQRVIAIHPQGVKDIYRITFNDGSSTECCKEHVWKYWEASNKSKLEKKMGVTGKLATTEGLISLIDSNRTILTPLCKPINFSTVYGGRAIDKISPYVVGVLLGDGCITTNVSFSTADEFIASEVKKELGGFCGVSDVSAKYNYRILHGVRNNKGHLESKIKPILKDLGIFGKKSDAKFIPKIYFTERLETRLSIVQGLMDTDGTVSKGGKVYYCTTSKQLAEDMKYMLSSLGMRVTITRKENDYLGAYILYIQGESKEMLFRLPRKKDIVKPFNGGFSNAGRKIDKIEYVGQKEAKCITVEASDGLYITDDFIVTHNSFIGCEWLLWNCLTYPNTRWFIGRKHLSEVRKSTIVTFLKVMRKHGIPQDTIRYNDQSVRIVFNNGSVIEGLELMQKPSDADFNNFGSTEYTGGWIEEAGGISVKAYEILKIRIGRHLNDEYQIKGKLLITANPAKNWTYTFFYKPFKDGLLPPNIAFIQSFVSDNIYSEGGYMERLKSLKGSSRERLYLGNWEYDDDPDQLTDNDAIADMFTNEFIERDAKRKCLVVDVAMYGSDLYRVAYFEGDVLVEHSHMDKSGGKDVLGLIDRYRKKYNLAASAIVYDADGVGAFIGGKGGFITGAIPFNGNASPVEHGTDFKRYSNLRSQCAFLLAYKINENGLYAYGVKDASDIETLTDELRQIKKMPNSEKLRIIPKDEVREAIGRSPDFSDLFMMKMYNDIRPRARVHVRGVV